MSIWITNKRREPKEFKIAAALPTAASSNLQNGGILAWVKENSEAIKIGLAVAAGLFAMMEYKASDYISRVKTASEVIEKFHASSSYSSLVKLNDFWMAPETAQRRAGIHDVASATEYRHFVHQGIKLKHSIEFATALRGLKSAAICAIQGRCEPKTMCMYLAQDIQDLRCNFRETIAEMSAHNGSCVVDEVSFFVDEYCKEWMSAYLGVNYAGLKDNYCLYDRKTKQSMIGKYCAKSIVHKETYNIFDRLIR